MGWTDPTRRLGNLRADLIDGGFDDVVLTLMLTELGTPNKRVTVFFDLEACTKLAYKLAQIPTPRDVQMARFIETLRGGA
jgi:hypothetical protein